MALKSTVFKAALQLADIDHEHYVDHQLMLARHPSETDERMMLRLAALAWNAYLLRDLCNGDGTLGFGAGLSSPDEPDVMLTDYTGRKRLWIEVGQPEEKPIAKACSKADAVLIYCFSNGAELWWRGIESKVARLNNLSVYRVPVAESKALGALAERSMTLQATLQEQTLTIGNGRDSVELECKRWK